ncbi:hypothetical protein BV22DRAFT_1108318 [Leucogyrophana mollusca]|uniref:Uncharacterized protein n=1 Tax=Leucogyrophana mollusca TaxID=85980 RepID=A0ACB8AYI2_9AGAM|nr:hypothetical protein BV22DRAFT_1108318 [Leucogyrophana mollusca]
MDAPPNDPREVIGFVPKRILKKLVIIGDGGCGKTCMLFAYALGRFPERDSEVPKVFDYFSTRMEFEGQPVDLFLCEVPTGEESYPRLRHLSYPGTDVALIVFSVNNYTSLENARDIWYPEVSHFCGDIPVVLVGNKTDLRSDTKRSSKLYREVTPKQGSDVAEKIGAAYVECSAKTSKGLPEVFQLVLQECIQKRDKKVRKRRCVVV